MAELEPVDHDPWASPFDAPDGLVRIPPQMNVPAQQQWGAQKGTDILGSLTGVTDAARAARGEMSPEEQKNFALTAMAGMLPMGRALKPVAKAAEEVMPQGIRAYHGSPHDFERFDLSKIGTGEGAQAYGHGLYFAEGENVAKSYRDTLAGPHNRLLDRQGVVVEPSPFEDGTWRIAKLNPEGQMKGRHGYAGVGLTDFEFPSLEAAVAHAKEKGLIAQDALLHEVGSEGAKIPIGRQSDMSSPFNQVVASNPGRMYEVAINADPEHFLHWDKPLSEQSEHVQKALRSLPFQPHRFEKDALGRESTGADFAPKGMLSVKQYREAGIPGIKYLDQGSRVRDLSALERELDQVRQGIATVEKQTGDTQPMRLAQLKADEANLARQVEQGRNPTHNYVVFDDKLIDIIKKYGIAGLIGTGASHFALQPVDHNPFEEKP